MKMDSLVTTMAAFHSTMAALLCHSLLYCSLSEKMQLIYAFLCTLSLISLSALAFTMYSKNRICKKRCLQEERILATCYAFLPECTFLDTHTINANENGEKTVEESGEDPTRLAHPILVVVPLPPGIPVWEEQLVIVKDGEDKAGLVLVQDRVGPQDEDNKKRKTKKRTRKKRTDPNASWEEEREKEEELVLLYPFTTSCSGIQRKIKEQFDQLVKSHQSNCLTITQVEQFTNFLFEAKKELQHRSEVIQRKFRITKALLMKADKSSFDRLHQQIDRIELEQKRLQEDAFVYNRVQQQLRHSPVYKKILKVCACPDSNTKTVKEADGSDNNFADISFEELLAQEKKDVFWQRHRKPKG